MTHSATRRRAPVPGDSPIGWHLPGAPGIGWRLVAVVAALASIAGAARGDISGRVLVAGSGNPGTPVPGAVVRVPANLAAPTAIAAADGTFLLSGGLAGTTRIAAALPYDPTRPANYILGSSPAADGDTNVEIRLEVLPTADNPDYTPASVFACASCHPEKFDDWSTSHHAGAGINAWVLDLYSGSGTPGGGAGYVYRATHGAGETGFCATCHTAMADVLDPGHVYLDEVTDEAALEGVNCVTCHQLAWVDENHLRALHLLGKSTYRFPLSQQALTQIYVWGPMGDVTFTGMRPSHSTLHTKSLFCAACHEYDNPATGAPGQHTYTEWEESPYAVPGPGLRSCQDCHMPPDVKVSENCVFGPVRDPTQVHEHSFVGSNEETLAANLALTLSASEEPGAKLLATATVDNFGAGHSFPTGISIRNAILLVTATVAGQRLEQLSGPRVPDFGSDDVPGEQDGDWAGYPGQGYAKLLQGRIDGHGPTVSPVLFIDAEGVAYERTIASGDLDTSVIEFRLPPGLAPGTVVTVEARLLYRRAFRALQVTKGWTQSAHGEPIEIEVHRETVTVPVSGTTLLEIPTLTPGALALFAGLVAALAVARLAERRRRSAAALNPFRFPND
ncbi:MAG: multiheme c-type cytochrome [Thermoanaerobaculia bacterium]